MANESEIVGQYRACVKTGGIWLREERGVVEIRGGDRAAWLNNLVTNVVMTLEPGEGNYAFATTVKGRTVFDANVLVLEDRIWLDIDRRWIEKAKAHLERYVITEDVQIADVSGTVSRAAVFGPRAAELAERVGFGNLAAMAWLQHVGGRLGECAVRMVRDDFVGLLGAEFFFVGDGRDGATRALVRAAADAGIIEVGREALEILRIEAGRPASVEDIGEEVVTPETGQVERGISYYKGCYLGQEVIERMRSHGVLARSLVGMRFEGDAAVPPRSPVHVDGREAGRTTSGCWSEALGAALSLGYLKSAHVRPGVFVEALTADGPRKGEVVKLPVR